MNSLQVANEKGLTNASPRMLKEVGDHALTYHEGYVRPSKVFVAKRLVEAKHKLLWDSLQELDREHRAALLDAFSSVSIRSAAIEVYRKFEVIYYAYSST